jgi:hypothetical protein
MEIPLEEHVRLVVADVSVLVRLQRELSLYVVRAESVPDGRVGVDLLVSRQQANRLRAAGHSVTLIAKLNQPQDLKREVSQSNRFASELERLRKRRGA